MPPDIQHEVERQAQSLIDSKLKPRYLQRPPKQGELNYLVDLYTRWRGPLFYFCLATAVAIVTDLLAQQAGWNTDADGLYYDVLS